MELRSLARYPFLSPARDYIQKNAPPLEKLLTDPLYYDVREKAFTRVMGALENGIIPTPVLLDDADIRDEMLSYPLARMLVSMVGDRFLVARYSLAEAKSAASNMEREKLDFLITFARDIGITRVCDRNSLPPGVSSMIGNANFSKDTEIIVHFSDYLRGTTSFNSPEWKMVNREVVRGFIALPRRNFIRLIEETIRLRILGELPLPVNRLIMNAFEDMAKLIKTKTEEMKDRFRDEDLGEFSQERFPPCVAHLVSLIQSNINLSHEARFFLAAFLFHIGLNMDGVIAIFSQSPDFDASLARYQLEHIRGDISGTKYTPPSCSTLKTNGICYKPSRLCKQTWMNHPLTYYKVKGKEKAEEGGKAEDRGA